MKSSTVAGEGTSSGSDSLNDFARLCIVAQLDLLLIQGSNILGTGCRAQTREPP